MDETPTADSVQVARNLYEGLSAIRSSVDDCFRRAALYAENRNAFLAALLELERLRLETSEIFDYRGLRNLPIIMMRGTLRKVQGSLAALVDDAYLMSFIGKVRIIPRTNQKLLPIFGQRETVERGLRTLLIETNQLLSEIPSAANADLERLRAIIPEQKIAPMQFDLRDGRLVLVERSSGVDPEDTGNVDAAKAELIVSGERLLDEIRQSNCDHRLVETVAHLQERISSNSNIIQIGLSNMACDIMCNQFEQELPASILSMLKSQAFAVGMYVAQFPEWHRFIENAAAAEISSDTIVSLRDVTDKLVSELAAKPDLVDPEIPRTFAELRLLIRDPAGTSKRAFFAIIRSMENLISRVFSFSADFLDETARETSRRLSLAISKVIVAGLLAIALQTAVDVTPIANLIGEMSWIRNAVEIVQRQIESLHH